MIPIIEPTIINYAPSNTPVKFKPVEWIVKNISIRLIPFFPFVPNPVQRGRHRNRLQTLEEFTVFWSNLLGDVPKYDQAWVAQVQQVDCGTTYIPQAGIIYQDSNTFGIWQNNSNAFTIVHPPQRPIAPEHRAARILSPSNPISEN